MLFRSTPQAPRASLATCMIGRDHEHAIHKVAFSVKPPRACGSSYAHSAAALHRPTGPGQGLALTFTRAGWDRWMWRQPKTHFFPFDQDGHFDVAYCQRSGVYYVVTLVASVWVLDMSAPVPHAGAPDEIRPRAPPRAHHLRGTEARRRLVRR